MTERIPGLPPLSVSRENMLPYAGVANIIVGDWVRAFQRGDVYDCVHDTLTAVLGISPSHLFGPRATVHEVVQACANFRVAYDLVRDTWKTEEEGPVETDAGDDDGQSRRHISIPNYGMQYYVLNFRHSPTSGPLRRRDFRVVSRLGLAVWDTMRLRDFGLALDRNDDSTTSANFVQHMRNRTVGYAQLTAWRSIFLQELRRLEQEATNFFVDVVPNAAREYVAAWMDTGVVGPDWQDLVPLLMWTPPMDPQDNSYDGPVMNIPQFLELNTAVVEMLQGMIQERANYEGLPGGVGVVQAPVGGVVPGVVGFVEGEIGEGGVQEVDDGEAANNGEEGNGDENGVDGEEGMDVDIDSE